MDTAHVTKNLRVGTAILEWPFSSMYMDQLKKLQKLKDGNRCKSPYDFRKKELKSEQLSWW